MSSDLLVIKAANLVSEKQLAKVRAIAKDVSQAIGMKCVVLEPGLDAEVHRAIDPLITQMIEEQRRTNELLLALVEGMAEQEEEDPDAEPETYMDGTLVR